MAALETSGLGKRYKRNWALWNCSLRLPTGRIAGLVGPNGAGKTTLLHLAVGLLQPSAGSVRVFGADPHGNRDTLARIGFLAQDTPLYKDFTGAELLTMGRRLNGRWDRPAEGCTYGAGAYNQVYYQPGSRFWLFQWVEAGLFTLLAAALLALSVHWVRRRIA